MTAVVTLGIDHVGLTVRSLDLSLAFFLECLGWTQKGGRPEYPAAYISDGSCVVTLWQLKEKGPNCEFDRLGHIGLHHLYGRFPKSQPQSFCFTRSCTS